MLQVQQNWPRIAKDCNLNKTLQQVSYSTQVQETRNLFYASHSTVVDKNGDVWYIDSGCSNHMTSRKDLLVDTNRNLKATVQVGTKVLGDVWENNTCN